MNRTESLRARRGNKFRLQIAVGWVFVALWAVFVVGFDFYLGLSMARQFEAGQSWTRSVATVTASSVEKKRGGRSVTYRPSIAYEYTIDGRTLTGSTIEAFGTGSVGGGYAKRLVAQHPAGAVVPVFVDPADSTRSALRVGIQASTFKLVMFALPFNAVLLGATVFLIRARRYADDRMLAWIVRDEGGRVVLRLAQWSPVTTGCTVAGVVSFVGLLGAMLGFEGEPPFAASGAVIGATLLSGLIAWAWRASAIAGARYDIEIDRTLRRVTLPRSPGSGLRADARFDELAVEMEWDDRRQVNKQAVWKLHVGRKDGSDRFTAYWLSRADAKRIGAWIARTCGVRLKVNGPRGAGVE